MSERYRPLFKLDSGGMAEVYVAEAESMAGFKKKVAIKRILPNLLKDERFVRMFLDEARLSLHLSHANIVSVFDIGKSAATYFIVMEYVEGPNLKAVLQHLARKRQVLPVHVTVWILNEILKGLDYAHRLRDPETGRSLGIVHRDISPPNILMSWNGEVKLTDFGLAKASTQLESTDPGVVKGKFSYLAPEAASGLDVDFRADLFAVGILGYEMLTGRRLFLGETDYQTVEAVRRAQIPSISQQNPEVTPDLETIMRKALARRPEDRYQQAESFADDLLAFLFSRSLKVSARDLSELISDLRRETPSVEESTARGQNVILRLIDDEFANIRSLDSGEQGPPTGSMPLDLGSTGLGGMAGYDPSAPLRVHEFDGDSPPPGNNEPTPVPTRGVAAMRPRPPLSPPLPPAQRRSLAPVVVVLVLLFAVGAMVAWIVGRGG
jgi:eukaryotic-like serine/threonine-protein kinase